MKKAKYEGTVYLIHFTKPLAHAMHYIGWTRHKEIDDRLKDHRSGRGAKLLRAVNIAGIVYEVVQVWMDVDRNFERKLKNRGGAKRICPECKNASKMVCKKPKARKT